MLIEKGDDKNNNVAGHPVEDHNSAEDEVANDDVNSGRTACNCNCLPACHF